VKLSPKKIKEPKIKKITGHKKSSKITLILSPKRKVTCLAKDVVKQTISLLEIEKKVFCLNGYFLLILFRNNNCNYLEFFTSKTKATSRINFLLSLNEVISFKITRKVSKWMLL